MYIIIIKINFLNKL